MSALSELVLVAIHADPDTVKEEMEALVDVHKSVARHWNTDDILIMGDFNSDSRFISMKNLNSLKLRSDKETFTWLISDDIDTTTADGDFTYDRSQIYLHLFTSAWRYCDSSCLLVCVYVFVNMCWSRISRKRLEIETGFGGL